MVTKKEKKVMPIPIKFPKIKIVNRCILCGRVIPNGASICNVCSNKSLFKKFKK